MSYDSRPNDSNENDVQQFLEKVRRVKFNPEEQEVWDSCMHTEGIWRGGVPMALATGFLAFYTLSKSSRFKSNAKWFAISSGVFGFFTGRVAYGNKCLEKVMALPNSTVKEQIEELKRFQRTGFDQEPQLAATPTADVPSETSRQSPMGSSLNIDNYRPVSSFDGFIPSNDDKNDRPKEEIDLSPDPVPERTLTYDDLRNKNRDEYKRRDARFHSNEFQPPTREHQKTNISKPTISPPTSQKTNKYGDVME